MANLMIQIWFFAFLVFIWNIHKNFWSSLKFLMSFSAKFFAFSKSWFLRKISTHKSGFKFWIYTCVFKSDPFFGKFLDSLGDRSFEREMAILREKCNFVIFMKISGLTLITSGEPNPDFDGNIAEFLVLEQ